jgi:aldehyde dehydrogenase (NAD+)/phenylacetaldehyde dehydrogenase
MREATDIQRRTGLPQLPVEARNPDGSWRLFIDGAWADSRRGERLEVMDPARGVAAQTVALAGALDVHDAVSAARAAFSTGPWRKKSAASRASLLLRLAQELDNDAGDLAVMETSNNGMLLRESRAMVKRCVTMVEFAAGVAQRAYGQSIPVPHRYVDFTLREPVGVCALIIPWNGPLISAIAKVAPAIALGNAVVLKPSELTPLTALKLTELFARVGLPAGVLNVITGGPEVGAALVAHPQIDKIAFTGSTAAGKHIMQAAADRVKRVTLELGGKAPNIFFGDVDVSVAVAGAMSGLLRNCGQTCIAGARMFVHRSIYEEFLARSLQAIQRIRVGPGTSPDAQIGPIVSQEQLQRVQGFVTAARDDGLEVHGGELLRGGEYEGGHFMAPGLVTQVSNEMAINQQEIFGPVGTVMPFADEDEVIALANDTPYGLAAGVWTHDIKRALRIVRELRVGTVWVNTYGWNFTEAPMGGYKQSGIGRENGDAVIDAYTEVKNVVLETSEEGTLDMFALRAGDQR